MGRVWVLWKELGSHLVHCGLHGGVGAEEMVVREKEREGAIKLI